MWERSSRIADEDLSLDDQIAHALPRSRAQVPTAEGWHRGPRSCHTRSGNQSQGQK
jgi:hypothetical protein